MEHNNESKTLKEIAQLTFDIYGMPGEDDSLALQASIDAFELYGYNPLSYAEIAELEKHCDLVLGLADIEADDEVDEDSPEGRYEMRLDYCNDDPERAAEIWGDFENDYVDALDKIKVLEGKLMGLTLSARCTADELADAMWDQSHMASPEAMAMANDVNAEVYKEMLEEFGYMPAEIIADNVETFVAFRKYLEDEYGFSKLEIK